MHAPTISSQTKPNRPLLNSIDNPSDLRRVNARDLPRVADELRAETINAVAVTGGHLGASLGVIELTVALHYVFNTPKDKLIWDVGHQAYPHKILTGRRDRIRTLRTAAACPASPSARRANTTAFGAAHSSTSISAGLGMAVARDLAGEDHNVVCVIGDGAISAGMAYEAMNNAGAMNSRLIVILNDNEMSIAPPVGAMSKYLTRLLSGPTYMSLRGIGKQVAGRLPEFFKEKARARRGIHPRLGHRRHAVRGARLLLRRRRRRPRSRSAAPRAARTCATCTDGPILVHVRTQKGKGYAPAEASSDKYHGVVKFDVATGKQHKAKSNAPSYTKVFGESLVKEAEQGRAHRRHHRGDAGRHRRRHFRQGVSGAHLRRRHRRAARGDFRGRAGDAKASSRSPRSTRPSCSAPTTRSCTTSRSSACRCASCSTAPAWSAPTARPMPARSTSPISAACPAS